MLRTRHIIYGVNSAAQTDVCIIKRKNEVLLLTVENKRYGSNKNPEGQVIAEAIAAFQHNNRTRVEHGMVR